MEWTDTHCHLQDPRLAPNLEAVLDRARAAGITRFVCCATRESDWDAVLTLAERHAGVIPLLGLHPWFLGEARPGWADRLEARLRAHRAGIGECGLDFAVASYDPALQVEVLRIHLRLAKALDRPLSLHLRQAWEALIQLIHDEGLPRVGAAIHAFSGSPELARRLQGLGFHLGFGCTLTNPRAHRSHRALRAVAPERLLLETDSPDLAPRHRSDWNPERPNEPANLVHVLRAAADLRREAPETLASQTAASAHALFGNLRPT